MAFVKLLSLPFVLLTGMDPPLYFSTPEGVELYVSGPGEIISKSPLKVQSGVFWVRTHHKAYSFQMHHWTPVDMAPESLIFCQSLIDAQDCTILEGQVEWNQRLIEAGEKIDFSREKTSPIEILPGIKFEHEGLLISWATRDHVPSDFFVIASSTANLETPIYQTRTQEKTILFRRPPAFSPLFIQISTIAKKRKKRFFSPTVPVFLMRRTNEMSLPSPTRVIHQVSGPLALPCERNFQVPFHVRLLQEGPSPQVVYERVEDRCPIVLPSLPAGRYELQLKAQSSDPAMSQYVEAPFELVSTEIPKSVEARISGRQLSWTSRASDPYFYQVQIENEGKRYVLVKWTSSLEIPSRFKGPFEARVRIGLPVNPPIFSHWSSWVKSNFKTQDH